MRRDPLVGHMPVPCGTAEVRAMQPDEDVHGVDKSGRDIACPQLQPEACVGS